MPNHQLSPNPPGCRSLTDPEADRLRAKYGRLWADPRKTCLTCFKEEKDGVATFRTRKGCGEIVTCDCSCLDQWRLSRWLLHAGVDLRYQRFSWDDVTQVNIEAQMAVLKYLDNSAPMVNQGVGLTLWSKDRGTGKTLLSIMFLKRLLAKGYDGYFTQFNDMLNQFTAGWRNEVERQFFIERVMNVGVLVVDDLGRESKGRENIVEAMFDMVIRARVAGCRPTFITTNYTPEEMLQGYGRNVLSLLSEVNTDVEVSGVDYRPIAKKQRQQDVDDGVVYPIVVL